MLEDSNGRYYVNIWKRYKIRMDFNEKVEHWGSS
jgi:hypothetical protein